tara:strand:- start:417 stop:1004 length:588 start_codon:yes stop_codon:yes gene_type:complete
MTKYTPKKTKLVYGIGINDANYAVRPTVNGKRARCNFYTVWNNMLGRCYSDLVHKIHPTYLGCTVASEWLLFSNFRAWMEGQEWEGRSLDKDLLFQHNKVYSPSTCIFVTAEINTLLIDSAKSRGSLPLGVSIRRRNKYQAQCTVHGKPRHLGYYDTPEEAHEVYKAFKYKHIAEVANQQSEPLKTALLNYVIEG